MSGQVASGPGAELLLLTRPHCGLCDEFLEELAHAAPALARRVRLADVDSRPDWRERFGLRIPVLLDAAGAVVCEGVLDAAAVAALAAAG
ncbi:MAG: glutaredoxin family protein [Nevskia sp.]|nr:glutaredoxin family protein [Nevskia sp.]